MQRALVLDRARLLRGERERAALAERLGLEVGARRRHHVVRDALVVGPGDLLAGVDADRRGLELDVLHVTSVPWPPMLDGAPPAWEPLDGLFWPWSLTVPSSPHPAAARAAAASTMGRSRLGVVTPRSLPATA